MCFAGKLFPRRNFLFAFFFLERDPPPPPKEIGDPMQTVNTRFVCLGFFFPLALTSTPPPTCERGKEDGRRAPGRERLSRGSAGKNRFTLFIHEVAAQVQKELAMRNIRGFVTARLAV